MARRGITNKPCPGCGDTGGRGTDKLCWKCEKALAIGRAEMERQANDPGKRAYFAPQSRYWPYYFASGDDREAREAMAALVETVEEADYDYRDHDIQRRLIDRYRGGGFDGGRFARFTPATAAAISRLDAAVFDLVKRVYDAGVREGTNILRGLADGRVSVVEFNKRTTGEGKE